MPETMSIERQQMVKAYGATVILTSVIEGMEGSINYAKKLAQQNNYFIPMQFNNNFNPQAFLLLELVLVVF